MSWTWTPITIVMQPQGSALPQTIDAFSVVPGAIDSGDTVTVSWRTSNATQVRLNGVDVGSANYANGSQTFTPVVDTDYVLAADGSVATKTQTLPCSVTVIGPPSGTMELVGNNTIWDTIPIDPVTHLPDVNGNLLGAEKGIMGYNGVISNGAWAYAPSLGIKGSMVKFGGGHNDSGGNEVYAFDLYTKLWTRMSDPSQSANALGINDPNNDWLHGELPDGSAMACHGFNVIAVIRGGTNGKGLMFRIAGSVLGVSNGQSTAWAHAFDLGVSTPAAPTIGWRRHSINACWPNWDDINHSTQTSCSFQTYDEEAGIVWAGFRGGFHRHFGKYDIATQTFTHFNQPNGAMASCNWGYMPQATAHPVHGLLLWVAGYGNYNTSQTLHLNAVDLTNPLAGLVTLSLQGDAIPNSVQARNTGGWPAPWGFDWDTYNDVGYISSGDEDRTHVFRVEAPALPSNATPADYIANKWTITKIALPDALPWLAPDPTNNSRTNLDAMYGHWRYAPSIRAFAYLTHTGKDKATFPDDGKVCLWYP